MSDGFDVARCAACERDVLLAWDLVDDELVRRCLHCGTVNASAVRTVAPADLSALGYDLPNAQAPHGERGCRDGQCGVRQPAGSEH